MREPKSRNEKTKKKKKKRSQTPTSFYEFLQVLVDFLTLSRGNSHHIFTHSYQENMRDEALDPVLEPQSPLHSSSTVWPFIRQRKRAELRNTYVFVLH